MNITSGNFFHPTTLWRSNGWRISHAQFVAPRPHERVRSPLDAGHDFQGQLVVSVAHRTPERDPGHVLDLD
jgi:hypothetical protein